MAVDDEQSRGRQRPEWWDEEVAAKFTRGEESLDYSSLLWINAVHVRWEREEDLFLYHPVWGGLKHYSSRGDPLPITQADLNTMATLLLASLDNPVSNGFELPPDAVWLGTGDYPGAERDFERFRTTVSTKPLGLSEIILRPERLPFPSPPNSRR